MFSGVNRHALQASIVVASVLVVAGISGWVGYRLAVATHTERELEVAQAYISHTNTVIEHARQTSEAQAQRITKVRQGQNAALSQVKRLEHELEKLSHDPARNFTADELQAFGALRDAYANGRSKLPDGLRGRPTGGQSTQGLRAEAPGMGLQLRESPR